MKKFLQIEKLQSGDKVAVLSPSFAAPGRWPHVYEFGVKRLNEQFGLIAVPFPSTHKIGASTAERTRDLLSAFEDPSIRGIIASLGGNDQVLYVKNLPVSVFQKNPKPFFGYSDTTHLSNHLWQAGVPSFYGGALFTEFAEQGSISPFTEKFLRIALFGRGLIEIEAALEFSDEGLNWDNPGNLEKKRRYQPNSGWFWDPGAGSTEGILWGGCLESVDELLRHGISLPSLEDFSSVVLALETSEGIPSASYVGKVIRALGERGILERVRGLLVGRPKAWEFEMPNSDAEKESYKEKQREAILNMVRRYNREVPVIQNVDFGHTSPQIPLPLGNLTVLDTARRVIKLQF